MTRRVLVIGAAGFLGRHIVPALERDGHAVAVAGRSPSRLTLLFPGKAQVLCDLTRDTQGDWLARLQGIDTIVNLAGLIRDSAAASLEAVHEDGPKALFEAAAQAGVRRVLHISAQGAESQASTRYYRTKGAAAEHLLRMADQGRLDACVLEPSIVVGRGGASTALFSSLAALPWPLRLGDGRQQVQPIHVDDVADAVCRLVRAERVPDRLAMVGPEALSTERLTSILRRWLALPQRRFIAIPAWALAATARAGDWIGRGPVSRETLAMLQEGNTGDPAGLTAVLDRPPLPLENALALTPATTADLWEARLTPLRPALRLALAVMWIGTGLLSLGIWPVSDSLDLLARVGLQGAAADVALYGAALLDIVLGLALLSRRFVQAALVTQLAVMIGFTAIITVFLPDWWLHPFGPVLKNVPVFVATSVALALEARPSWTR